MSLLVDPAVAKARWPANLDGLSDQHVQGVVEAASEWIVGEAGREFVETQFSETYSEDALLGRYGEQLAIKNPPVKTSPAPTVTEDGKSLTVTDAYDGAGAFEVLFDPDKGLFYRTRRLADPFQPGNPGWSRGLRNIVVTYTGAAFPGGVPKKIESACVELSYKIWQQAAKAGAMESVSYKNMTSRASRELSDASMRAIKSYIQWGRP